MRVGSRDLRTIWADGDAVAVIDQTRLPHALEILHWRTLDDAVAGIRNMVVRGAPLIGVAGAYGLALALRADSSDASLARAAAALLAARPTAVNLRWALERARDAVASQPASQRADIAWDEAARMADEDCATCEAIGRHGSALLRATAETRGRVDVLTHCNAGWLATVDWGTALSPVYAAHRAGIDVHVWVDETRPRNQGASLTAWELAQEGIPHTLIVDNAGGHLMQQGRVDLVLVGSDRTTATGDVCNKIGTYLKALAAHDNGVRFYAALPASTIDFRLRDGRAIPIEERGAEEVTHITGVDARGATSTVRIVTDGTVAANWAFDVTPSRLVTGLVTERGLCEASEAGIRGLFPDLVEAVA
ncbi:MAG: mtnA [Rhodospirillales bacterium]|nr:mtnA [Rhodospirillales bacterium]